MKKLFLITYFVFSFNFLQALQFNPLEWFNKKEETFLEKFEKIKKVYSILDKNQELTEQDVKDIEKIADYILKNNF